MFPLGLVVAPFLRRDHGSRGGRPERPRRVPWRADRARGPRPRALLHRRHRRHRVGPGLPEQRPGLHRPAHLAGDVRPGDAALPRRDPLARSAGDRGHGPVRGAERRAAGLGRRPSSGWRDRRVRAGGGVAGGRRRASSSSASGWRSWHRWPSRRPPGSPAGGASRPGRAPGPGRRRRRPVQPVQLRRRPLGSVLTGVVGHEHAADRLRRADGARARPAPPGPPLRHRRRRHRDRSGCERPPSRVGRGPFRHLVGRGSGLVVDLLLRGATGRLEARRPRRPRRPRTRTRRSSGRTTANPRRGTCRSRRCP